MVAAQRVLVYAFCREGAPAFRRGEESRPLFPILRIIW